MSFPTSVGTLTVYAGDTFTQTFTFKEDDAAIDLDDAGWSSWAAQFRTSPHASTAVDFTVDDSSAASGQITISLTPVQTAALPANGVFDLQANQSGLVRTWIIGSLTTTKDVTRG